MKTYNVGEVVRITTWFYAATILLVPMQSTDLVANVATAAGFPTSGNYKITTDNEDMTVTAGQGTTAWTVVRGVGLLPAVPHILGAEVRASADPSSVSFSVLRDVDRSTVMQSGVRDNLGVWHSDFTIDRSGRWAGKTTGSGTLTAVSTWTFSVRPPEL